jgi:hypothetical protein
MYIVACPVIIWRKDHALNAGRYVRVRDGQRKIPPPFGLPAKENLLVE